MSIIKHSVNYYDTVIKNIESRLNSTTTVEVSEILQIRTDIDSDIISINGNIKTKLDQITTLEMDNKILSSKIQALVDKREGSNGMYDDSRNLYNTKLIENSIIFLSICVICYNVYKSTQD